MTAPTSSTAATPNIFLIGSPFLMNIGLNTGVFAYQLDIGLNAWLLGVLYLRGKGQEYRYFYIYTAVRLLQVLVLFPLFIGSTMETYSRAYWLTSPILLCCQLWVLGEFWPDLRRIMFWLGLAVAVAQLALVIPRSDAAIGVEFAVEITVAMGSCWAIVQNRQKLLAAGMLCATLFPSFCRTIPFLLNAQVTRYIPSYAFLVAQICWIVWARRLEPVTSLE